jgi:hypothetical protein
MLEGTCAARASAARSAAVEISSSSWELRAALVDFTLVQAARRRLPAMMTMVRMAPLPALATL